MAYTYHVCPESEEEYEEVLPPDRQRTVADQPTSSNPESRLQDNQTPDTRSEVATKEVRNLLENESVEQNLLDGNVAVANDAQAREFALSGALKDALIAEFSQRFSHPISIQTVSLAADIVATKQSSGDGILRRVMEWLVGIPVQEDAKGNLRPGAAHSRPDDGVARTVQAFEGGSTKVIEADELGLLPKDHHRSSAAPPNDPEIISPKASNHEILQDDEKDLDSNKFKSEDPLSQTLQRFPEESELIDLADDTDKNPPTSSSQSVLASPPIKNPPPHKPSDSGIKQEDNAIWSLLATERQDDASGFVTVASGKLCRIDDVEYTSAADSIDPEHDDDDFENRSEAMDMSSDDDLDNRSEAMDMISDDEDGFAASSYREISQDPDYMSAQPSITKFPVNLLKRT